MFSVVFTTKTQAQEICPSREISPTLSCSNPETPPYSLHLGLTNLSNPHFLLQNEQFQEFDGDDGTATLTGTLVNVENTDIQFDLKLTFKDRSDDHEAKLNNDCLSNAVGDDFYYYKSYSGTITGINKMVGAHINVRYSGTALQVGNGANWFSKALSFGAATELLLVLSRNPRNGFSLAKINRGGSILRGHLALNLTDCNAACSDSDGDGICDDQDCAPYDKNIPAEPGTACDDSDEETVNDIILEDGCSCLGEIEENTEITSEVCTARTAFNTTLCQGNDEGTKYGGYLLLNGLGKHYSLANGQFFEYNDGTARLIGEWINIENNAIKFQVDIKLAGRTISTPPNSPKGHWCLETDESSFYYYTQTKGILKGMDAIAGALLVIGRAGPAFQFGLGANATNAELNFGAAGWITATIANQPSTGIELSLLTSSKGSNGDININLSGDPMACIENRADITPTCLEDITVTANLGETGKAVNWNTPTFSSSCLYNANMDCTTTSDQLEGFDYLGTLNGSKYFCSTATSTYAQAKSMAIQRGGYLAVICDQTENNFIASKITADVVWIGLSDDIEEGSFIWANGDGCGYTNWMGSEPNDGHNTSEFASADHIVLQKNSGGWFDRNGKATYKYIVELPCTGTMPKGTADMTQIEGLTSGKVFPTGETMVVYEGKDGCGNTTTCSFKVTVKAPYNPCAGDNAPSVTIETQNPDCDRSEGTITFKFNDHPNRTNIEFSLDGGSTYPLNVKDYVGSATFNNLNIGDYELFVRWGNNECPVDLGVVTLSAETKTSGGSCDDGDERTKNDVIQADGCTCLGELIEENDATGGCGDLLKNPSFEDNLSPWMFNSNTKYNRSTRYRADGNYMVWIYKRYSYQKDAAIYQDAVAIPGAIYSFSFYAGTHRPSYNHEVAIEFYNQYGAKLKRKAVQVDFDVDNDNVLKEYQLTETAPSGTTKIRFIGTASGDYLKLDAICARVDKSHAQTSGRAAEEDQEEIVIGGEVLYQGFDAVTLGSSIKKEGVKLDWFSKNSHLPSKFIVEKSLDGQNFEQIDEVMVDDEEDLSVLDEAPDYGTNFYRVIQQFDTGQEMVSNIREEKYMIDPASVTIYPNPAVDNLNLRIGHFQTLKGTIRIFSPLGQQVFERDLDGEDKHVSIDVSNYKNGMYFLLIEAENRRPIERQIIIENLK